jgi:hypothetical protein
VVVRFQGLNPLSLYFDGWKFEQLPFAVSFSLFQKFFISMPSKWTAKDVVVEKLIIVEALNNE